MPPSSGTTVALGALARRDGSPCGPIAALPARERYGATRVAKIVRDPAVDKGAPAPKSMTWSNVPVSTTSLDAQRPTLVTKSCSFPPYLLAERALPSVES